MINQKLKYAFGFTISVMLMTGSLVSSAEEDPVAVRDALVKKIQKTIHTPEKQAAAIKRGEARTMFCKNCHGEDGNSKRPEIPNLAGQNPAYLVLQVDKFATGERKSLVMQTLAKQFTEQDKLDLAVFYNAQEVQQVEFEPTRVPMGKAIYNRLCVFCHKEDGKGEEEGFARIAGQKPVYVINTLKRFRANANEQINVLGTKRSSARMEQVTQNLTDSDIENLAAYIASLK